MLGRQKHAQHSVPHARGVRGRQGAARCSVDSNVNSIQCRQRQVRRDRGESVSTDKRRKTKEAAGGAKEHRRGDRTPYRGNPPLMRENMYISRDKSFEPCREPTPTLPLSIGINASGASSPKGRLQHAGRYPIVHPAFHTPSPFARIPVRYPRLHARDVEHLVEAREVRSGDETALALLGEGHHEQPA